MAEPNDHPPNAMSCPSNLRELLTKAQGNSQLHNCGITSRAKGLKSLNMELSWRPLQFLRTIPIQEELAGVDGEFRDNHLTLKLIDVDEKKVATLLDQTTRPYSATDEPRSCRWNTTPDDIYSVPYPIYPVDFEVVLTRSERRHLTVESDPLIKDETTHLSGQHVGGLPATEPESEQVFDQGRELSSAVDDSAIFLVRPKDTETTEAKMLERQADYGLFAAETEHETFLPPSFDLHADPSTLDRNDRRNNNLSIGHEPVDDAQDGSEYKPSHSTADIALMNTSLATPSLAQFLAFRNFPVQHNFPSLVDSSALDHAADVVTTDQSSTGAIPETIFDRNTLTLPSPWRLPPYPHFYLASLELIQKRPIVHSLSLETSRVQLVERETLGGVDLILDPHTTVIFASLSELPIHCETLLANIILQSWRFSRILVIWEYFHRTASHTALPQDSDPEMLMYPLTSIKAIKKLRRDLAISEALEKKNTNTTVHFAFASDANEAAKLVRCFGDYAEADDTTGSVVWGTRDWLDHEAQEVFPSDIRF